MSICFSMVFHQRVESLFDRKKKKTYCTFAACSLIIQQQDRLPRVSMISLFQPGLNASFEQPRIGMQALQERFWAYTVQRHLKMFMWQKCCIGTSHRILLDVSQCCSWVVSQFEQTAAVKARPDTNSATKHHWRHFCKMLTSA